MNITEVIVVKPSLISFIKVTKHNSNFLPNSHHKNSDVTIENGRGVGGRTKYGKIIKLFMEICEQLLH